MYFLSPTGFASYKWRTVSYTALALKRTTHRFSKLRVVHVCTSNAHISQLEMRIGLSFRSAPSRKTVGFSGALGSSPAAPITINVWPCKAETVHID